MTVLAVLLGIATPLILAVEVAGSAGGPIATMGVLSLSAAVNAVRPIGGGMVVEGTDRVRFAAWERTFDTQRTTWEKFFGPFLLAAATLGGFFVYVPPIAALWRAAQPIRPPFEEVLAVAGLIAVVVVGFLRNPRELPLYRWRAELDAGGGPKPEIWRERLRRIASIARPTGSIGHVGGIGARTVGLHEVLDAERILRGCLAMGIREAAPLHEGCLRYLASQAIPTGGFPVYPGGLPRRTITERAVEALGNRL
jgi:hypothetical protein